MRIFLLGICFTLGITHLVSAQTYLKTELTIATDSARFSYAKCKIQLQNEEFFFFTVKNPQEEVEITLKPYDLENLDKVVLNTSEDFIITDSLRTIEDSYIRGRIRFQDLTKSKFPRFVFTLYYSDGKPRNIEFKLYPFFMPVIQEIPEVVELFRGEEKVVDLNISNDYDLQYTNQFFVQDDIEYRLMPGANGPRLSLRSNNVGKKDLIIDLKSVRPFINEQGLLGNKLQSIRIPLVVKPSRISFINLDKPDYYLEPAGSSALMIQLDYSSNFELGKTYRIEDSESKGGRLIAEIFTRSYIDNNNKILASLHTYALHRQSEGYLYIKDGDITRFFTNFNIIEKPRIAKVSILRQGKDWTTNSAVFPDEQVEVKIEGEGLSKSIFRFGDGKFEAQRDTTRIAENAAYYYLKIPADVKETRIPVSMNGQNTSFEFMIREHQKPRELDFIKISYGEDAQAITLPKFNKPVLFENEIRDVNLIFEEDEIDSKKEFFGVQYIDLQITLIDKDNRMLEVREIENIKIAPAENSPRYASYDRKNASPHVFRLNDYLANKTYLLKPWSRIEIVVKHRSDKYGEDGFSQKLMIIRSERFSLDLQVSFPAGLLSKRFNQPGIGSLTGISTAAMANFTFYKKGQIAKVSPIKLGVGFLALNALSSLTTDIDEDEKDIGIVTIVSFYPINSESKIKFPLFAGTGYLFKSNTMFLLIGPGVQFNF
ncbi:hypothetical protein QWY31_00160 [Cytophagales bacterium LB-30]|uniref:Uncharacterized protein n=1 Tax=Shiella aurantiaca TaxID=3058365 RepID=A0ABT8F0B9_9BACT|nr:hypothetical protein [Shiella aurantiaca]MDN4163887.1 hypothetical protein [Shiella aurantiaca]